MSFREPNGLQGFPPELLSLIVSFACSDYTEGLGPWAPNSLARTCRALSEPALNWLWKTLPNIAPLVYTLPREFWTVENTDEIQLFTKTPIKIMTLAKDIDYDSCGRFRMYARRVRSVGGVSSREKFLEHPVRNIEVHPALMRALESVHTTQPILPNLQQVSIRRGQTGLVPTPGFLSPSLKEVRFSMDLSNYSSEHEQEILQSIERLHACHRLNELMLMSSCMTRVGAPLAPAILELVGNLPNLNSLTLWMDGEGLELDFDRTPISSAARLQVLRHASFILNSPDQVRLLLRQISGDHLEHLEVIFTAEATATALYALCEELAQRHPRLQHLDLGASIWHLHEDRASLGSGDVIPASTLAPLLRLTQLRVVKMEYLAVAVDDALVRDISAAWPKLTTLSIGTIASSRVPDMPHLVSLSALACLAYRCKELDTLELPLDMSAPRSSPLDNISGLPYAFGLCASPLKRLDVCRSNIEEHRVVPTAGYLSDLFPQLVCISCRWHVAGGDAWDEGLEEERLQAFRWRAVASLVSDFVLVRAQEGRAYEMYPPLPLTHDGDEDSEDLVVAAMGNQEVIQAIERSACRERSRQASFYDFCKAEGYIDRMPQIGSPL